MIALFLNSISNTFLSGRVRLILGNFGFRQATFEPEPKNSIAYKRKHVYTKSTIRANAPLIFAGAGLRLLRRGYSELF